MIDNSIYRSVFVKMQLPFTAIVPLTQGPIYRVKRPFLTPPSRPFTPLFSTIQTSINFANMHQDPKGFSPYF
ncbi:MAG: hypothetical protein H6654_12550 [Ardenticatenaceae bacterium]|nr:hypothetical protein [Anaerolineales bacterium]MCB8937812.1 hypothetical protein [Ardenticatenaceae bacterium]MCB8974381.1 hypothetical protein [Ardenticatenaceae bacterium]